MLKKYFMFLIVMTLPVFVGCTTAEMHKRAGDTGRTAGEVISIPQSVSEGAAEGIAGEPESNPYGR